MERAKLIEESSTYTNNSALLGGVMACSKCEIYTVANQYLNNIANEGGVLYIESDSYLSSRFD